MIVETKLVRLFHASAITAWPFIFIDPGLTPTFKTGTLAHESVHLAQQRRWAIYGLGIGLLAWHFLYLLCLPVWKNPWRRKWETEAYMQGQKLDKEQIDGILKRRPYYLWS